MMNDENQTDARPDTETLDDAGGGEALADISRITGDLVSDMPEPSEHAIEADREKREARNAQWADLRDTDGNPFDPDLHVTDADGEPKLTKNGKLRKRPGRKAKGSSAARPGSKLGGIPSTEETSAAQSRAQARATGIAAANALITTGVALGGDEWRPVKDEAHGLDERAQLEDSFAGYFEAKGMTDIPPGVALSIAVSMYALPRFTMPKTQTRMQKAKEWIAKKWAVRKARKGKGKNDGAQSDSRDDGKRKDDASEKASN